MKGLFNQDNWFWQRMNDIADMLLLSLMWIVCCLPVVTIGPATVALYYVSLKKVNDQADEGIWKLYWRAFRDNWKLTGAVGLAFVALGVLLYVDVQFYAQAQGALRPLFGAMTVVGGALYLVVLPYLIGQMAWFQNTLRRYLISAFYLSLRHLLRSLAMVGITAVMLLGVYLFPPLLILAPALATLGHAAVLTKIFDRYTPQQDGDEPPTEDE